MSGAITEAGKRRLIEPGTGKTYIALLMNRGNPPEIVEPAEGVEGRAGYIRVRTYPDDWKVQGGTLYNSKTFKFPEATGPWGRPEYIALMDQSKEGQLLAYASLNCNCAIGKGDTAQLLPGDLSITWDDGEVDPGLLFKIAKGLNRVGWELGVK